MVDRVGQQLGNYIIRGKLGDGGFADVYLGEHIHLGTNAAIKILNTRLPSEDIEKFRNEARNVARLSHPHIVRVLEFSIEGNMPFLVMEYAPFGTLRQRHPRGTKLPLLTIVEYVAQIASGLQYAHDKHLTHRDVKPQNMLIGQNGDLLLSDFGLAIVTQSSLSQITQEGGTVAYMAPEQIHGKPRPASDQYSLGIVVYEWLTGDRPFYGSLAEIVNQHLYMIPPQLCKQVPTIPQPVEEVVMTALAKDPHHRFDSVQKFARELQWASQQQSTFSQVMVFPITPLPSLPPPPSPPNFLDAPTVPNPMSPPSQKLSMPVAPKAMAVPVVISPITPPPPVAPFDPVTPFPPVQKHHSTRKFILAGLALLILLLGGFGIYYPIELHNSEAMQQATMTVGAFTTRNAPLTVTARVQATETAIIAPYDNAIAANGIMFGFNAGHTHYTPYERILSPTNVSNLVQDWDVSVRKTNYSSPVVANGVVYVGMGNDLYAFDAKKGGAILWEKPTGGTILASPAVFNDDVYVGSQNSKFYAFDAKSGSLLWETSMSGGFISSSAIVNSVIYVGSDDNYLYALNAKTGEVLWKEHTEGVIDSSPSVANEVVYVGSKDGNLYAFDANKGTLLWKIHKQGRIISSPTFNNGVVYIAFGDENLYAYNVKSRGRPLWTVPALAPYGFLSPAVANGIVYIGNNDGNLYAFNLKTGGKLWTVAPGNTKSSPAIANGVVYIGSSENKQLYAYDANSSNKLWATTTDSPIYSSPAIAYGVVYVASSDGTLYAFHLPGISPY